MNLAPRAPTLSLLLIDGPAGKAPAALERAVARGCALEIVRAAGNTPAALAEAAARCAGDFVYPTPPDLRLTDTGWAALATALASDPDAEAFRLRVRGLPADPRWRGRRCRSHERNLESLRFACIAPAGALVFRRDALAAALAGLPADGDSWRELGLGIARTGRVAEVAVEARRSTPMAGERPYPGFADARPARVLVFGQIEVSTSLYFDALEGLPGVDVGFRAMTSLAVDAVALASADLVILVRELHRFWDEGVIAFLDAAAVPYVWFADDNFLALRREGGAGFFTEARMRTALAGAAAVWASTPALAAAHVWLHPKVEVWGPALDPAQDQPAPAAVGPLTIAIPGGDFRLRGLDAVLPELEALSVTGLRILATPAGAARLRPALRKAEVVELPRERSFRQHVRQWRRYAPDLVLHPTGATANAPYKAPTAAILAGYLGAVPVVADEPAYGAWREAEGVLRLADLGRAAAGARDAGWRAEMAGRLSAVLAERFSLAGRPARLAGLARRPPRRKFEAVAANILDAATFSRRRAALRAANLTRRIRDRLRPPE
jgi:hypothetical protein